MKSLIILTVFGVSYILLAVGCKSDHGDAQDARQDAAIRELQLRVASMEDNMNENIALLNEQGALTEQTQSQLQTIVNGQQAALTQLQTYESIIEFIDPCGDGPGYDEVILRTKFGKLIVYFETGNKRFLTLLGPGSYATTDQQSCVFNVSNDFVVSW